MNPEFGELVKYNSDAIDPNNELKQDIHGPFDVPGNTWFYITLMPNSLHILTNRRKMLSSTLYNIDLNDIFPTSPDVPEDMVGV